MKQVNKKIPTGFFSTYYRIVVRIHSLELNSPVGSLGALSFGEEPE